MFCNKCGNKLDDNAKFCSKCGNKIETDITNSLFNTGDTSEKDTSKELFDMEKMKSINSNMLNKLKERKYLVSGALGIIVLMLIIIPMFNKQNKNMPENREVVELSSDSLSSETSYDGIGIDSTIDNSSLGYENNEFDENDISSAEEVNYSNMTADERREYDLKKRKQRESEWEQGYIFRREIDYTTSERLWGKEGVEEERPTYYKNSITEVYNGQGQEYLDYMENQNILPRFVEKLQSVVQSENDGSLGMRFEVIGLLPGNHDYTEGYGLGYTYSGKDMLPFVETLKTYLKGWGVYIHEPPEQEKLIQEFNGFTYQFYGVDTNGFTIMVNVYFETVMEESLSRILIWTEDADNAIQ